MKNLKNLYFTIITCMLSVLAACDNELDIENDEVALRVGETVTVNIKNAGKNCTAEVDNPNIVTATVTDGQLELYATDEGSAIVRLTNADNESANLVVTAALNLKNIMWFIGSDVNSNVFVSAYMEDVRLEGYIWNLLRKKLPFTAGKRYTFVEEGEKKPATWDDIAGIQYQFDDGLLVAEDEAGEKYTCTIIQRTDKSMTTQEDLTEYYQTLYPDAGIAYVKRNITWTRYRPY